MASDPGHVRVRRHSARAEPAAVYGVARAARQPRAVNAIAFIVGGASLGTEIAAARLLAPWFGDSTIIWANTIATVLVALSVGYWVGGRMADNDPTLAGLARLVLAAAVLLAAVPFVSGPFLRTSVRALDDVSAGAFVGSLLAVSALIAVPVLLLGMVSPYAVRLRIGSVHGAGETAGRLYAISTLGSLAGVFTAALLLIPFAGTRRTFLVFALLLAGAAAIGLGRRTLLAAGGVAVLIALPAPAIKAADGGRVLWEHETPYQYARVVQSDDGTRRLELNEGQAVHSIYRPGRWLTGDYWDEPLVLPFAATGRAPRSVAVLGGAAGTVARAYGHFFAGTRVDLVEIDGDLVDAGRRLFDLRGPRLHTHVADARPYLRNADRKWDAIFVDAYHQPYIPFHLATREFFAEARAHLNPGGSVIVNVGHPERSQTLERTLTRTLRSAFSTVLRDPAQDTNTQLLATDAPVPGSAAMGRALGARVVPPSLVPTAGRTLARLQPSLHGGEVLTDDRAPVEWLVDSSLVQVAADGRR